MKGLIALVGSGEYLPVMEDVDRYLLANCGADGRTPRVVCLPTAAGREGQGSIERWSRMGIDHFSRIGAEVQAPAVIDQGSADDPQHAAAIEQADVIYFSGGDPGYLHHILTGSRAWGAAQKAWTRGAVYAGCSAGAMILGRQIPDFRLMGLRPIPAFGLVPVTYIIPHFDAIPGIWKPLINSLRRRMKDGEIMLGIDENTALVGRLNEAWVVMGRGRVHVFERRDIHKYSAGDILVMGNQS